MKDYVIILFLLSSLLSNAQSFDKSALTLGYQYSGKSALQIGFDQRLTDPLKPALKIGIDALIGNFEKNKKIIPQAHITYEFGGLYVNPYAVEPQVFVTLFDLVKINTGYAIPFHKSNIFKGITFGVQLRFGLTKASDYYDHVSLRFF